MTALLMTSAGVVAETRVEVTGIFFNSVYFKIFKQLVIFPE